MNNEIQIRVGQLSDAKTIAECNIAMAKETEGKILSFDIIFSGVEYLMNHQRYGFYLVAERAGKIVGSLMITSEWSDWRNGLFWWVQSVYIYPESRRMGAYGQLYQHVKTLSEKEGNVCGVRLYVEKNNTNAQQTYKKLGMIETDYILFEEEFKNAKK